MRADAGYFAGALARASRDEHIDFAIGARRIAPLWRLLDGISDDDRTDATGMHGAQVAVAGYCPDWWPAGTSLLIRWVRLDPVGLDYSIWPGQTSGLGFWELATGGGIIDDLSAPSA